MKKTYCEFEGDVLRSGDFYEIVNEIGDGLTEVNGILKAFENKKVCITIEEV